LDDDAGRLIICPFVIKSSSAAYHPRGLGGPMYYTVDHTPTTFACF